MSNDPKYAAKKEAIGVSMNVLTKLWSDRISSSVKDDKKEIFIFNGRQGRSRQYTQHPDRSPDWFGPKGQLKPDKIDGVNFGFGASERYSGVKAHEGSGYQQPKTADAFVPSIYLFSDFLKEVIEKDELDTDDVCPKFVKSIAKEDRKPLIVELDVNELHNNEGVSLEEAERLESEIGKDVEVVNPENEEKVEKAGEPKKKRLRNDWNMFEKQVKSVLSPDSHATTDEKLKVFKYLVENGQLDSIKINQAGRAQYEEGQFDLETECLVRKTAADPKPEPKQKAKSTTNAQQLDRVDSEDTVEEPIDDGTGSAPMECDENKKAPKSKPKKRKPKAKKKPKANPIPQTIGDIVRKDSEDSEISEGAGSAKVDQGAASEKDEESDDDASESESYNEFSYADSFTVVDDSSQMAQLAKRLNIDPAAFERSLAKRKKEGKEKTKRKAPNGKKRTKIFLPPGLAQPVDSESRKQLELGEDPPDVDDSASAKDFYESEKTGNAKKAEEGNALPASNNGDDDDDAVEALAHIDDSPDGGAAAFKPKEKPTGSGSIIEDTEVGIEVHGANKAIISTNQPTEQPLYADHRLMGALVVPENNDAKSTKKSSNEPTEAIIPDSIMQDTDDDEKKTDKGEDLAEKDSGTTERSGAGGEKNNNNKRTSSEDATSPQHKKARGEAETPVRSQPNRNAKNI